MMGPTKARKLEEQRLRQEKERAHKKKISRRNRRYRRKNKEELNQKARERMAKKRAAMSPGENEEAKARQQLYSRKSYQKRRDDILRTAEKKRHQAFIEKHGQDEFDQAYPSREVQPRYLLGLKDDPSKAEEYQKAYKRWRRFLAAEKEYEDYQRSLANHGATFFTAITMSPQSAFVMAEPEYGRLELKGVLESDWLKWDQGLSGEALKDAIRRRTTFRAETLERLSNESADISEKLRSLESQVYRIKRELEDKQRRASWMPSLLAKIPDLKRELHRSEADLDYTRLQSSMLSERILRLSRPAPPNNITRPRRRPKRSGLN
ncbi:hypothetical protein V5O48_009474 [Marasmius crinis-equi]|uniref:Uncharacterized protein n=1 Tax=Marasmius crinis-equi TaxID=585013 RepID=A0ABR3FBD4_9AGAR